MSILRRFKEIMAVNIEALFNNMEHPEKMIDHYISQMEKDFGEVKNNAAQVIVAHKRAVYARENCENKIVRLHDLALKAKDNEEDSKTILAEMLNYKDELSTLVQTEIMAEANRQKMIQMHDKLQHDILVLKQKKSLLQARLAIVRTNEIAQKYNPNSLSYSQAMIGFNKAEERINDMFDMSCALEELDSRESTSPILALEEKYGGSGFDSRVEEEYQKLLSENPAIEDQGEVA